MRDGANWRLIMRNGAQGFKLIDKDLDPRSNRTSGADEGWRQGWFWSKPKSEKTLLKPQPNWNSKTETVCMC